MLCIHAHSDGHRGCVVGTTEQCRRVLFFNFYDATSTVSSRHAPTFDLAQSPAGAGGRPSHDVSKRCWRGVRVWVVVVVGGG